MNQKFNEDALTQCRNKVDLIDIEIQKLIHMRADLACEIGKIKKESQPNSALFRPQRETQILENVISRNKSLIENRNLVKIFKTILNACLSIQKSPNIVYLGPEGTYSHTAAKNYFGTKCNFIPVFSIEDIFKFLEENTTDFGIVPLMNSTSGIVEQSLEALKKSKLHICGDIIEPISHCLLSNNNDISQIKFVHAHEQSLKQCSTWLKTNMPHASQICEQSNGIAAEIAKNSLYSAAIAGVNAAKLFDLQIILEDIQDERNNSTRFIVISHYSNEIKNIN